MMADALMRSRDGTVGQAIALQFNRFPNKPVGDTASLKRWESLLRFNVALFDLLSGLKFVVGNDEAGLEADGAPLVTMRRPNDAFFQTQLQQVISYAELRPDRASEIVTQMQPQTPFWSAAVHMHPAHSQKTLEMVELALGFSSIICMRFKAAMAVARPVDMSTEIQPIIATPSHSAFPSGHATEAFMIAYTLPYIVSRDPATQDIYKKQLLAQAERIAVNRTVAGVHFPVDSFAGQLLAKALASYFLQAAGIPNAPIVTCLVSSALFGGPEADFNLQATEALERDPNAAATIVTPAQPHAPAPLAWIAQKAADEWV